MIPVVPFPCSMKFLLVVAAYPDQEALTFLKDFEELGEEGGDIGKQGYEMHTAMGPKTLFPGPLHLSQSSPLILPTLYPPPKIILVGHEPVFWCKPRTSLTLHDLVFSSAWGGL